MGNPDVTKSASDNSHDNDDNNQYAEDNTDQKRKASTNDHNLRFMFDVPMVKLCPSLLNEIRITPHLVDIFASQFLWQHLSDGDPKKCENIPFYNMYLAEGGFQTELHVDSAHTAFVASVCVGRKKWRIMTPHDHGIVHSQLSEPRSHTKQQERSGNEIVGKQVATPLNGSVWVMSDIQKPFDTWTADSPLHTLKAGVTVYEGILEPGEVLYIPVALKHSATASTATAAMRGTFGEDHPPNLMTTSKHLIITVSHYYGPLALDFLKVWCSLKTGSTLVDNDDLGIGWWKMVIVSCHVMMDMTVTILQACGVPPMADDVVMMSVVILLFFVVLLVGYCCSSATNKPKRKEE